MALYNRLKQINSVIGGNILRFSNLSLRDYNQTITDKNTAAGLLMSVLRKNGVDSRITISELLFNSEYFNILNNFLSLAQTNDVVDAKKSVVNQWGLFTETGNVQLLAGDTESYGYPNSSIQINMVEINDNQTQSGDELFTKKYRLVGTVNLQEAAETAYVLPLGIISNESLEEEVIIRGGAGNSSVSCLDTLFIDVTTPLNNDSYVTNIATGDYVSATNGFLSFDNTIIGPADYTVFLTLSSSVAFNATVNIDTIIEATSFGSTSFQVGFQTV